MSLYRAKISDLGKIVTGKTPSTQNKDNFGGNIPFITPVDMTYNRNVFFTERYVSSKGAESVKGCVLPPKTVCVSCIGSDMGKSVITTQTSITNQQINSIIVSEKNNYMYVYYLMRMLESTIKSLGKNGTAVPILSKSKFSEIEIQVHDFESQCQIAKILSTYDDLIENNQKQIKLLEEAAQRLYKEWFVDLRFPGYEKTAVVDGVPEGWNRCSLNDVIAFNPKVSLDRNREKQFVPMSALSTNSMVLNSSEYTFTLSNSGSKFQNGDTLLARITPCLENGKTAFVFGIDSDEGAVGSTEYIVMRSKELNPYMVYILARTDDFRQYAVNSMSGSDGRQRVQVDKLMAYPFLKPPACLIQMFTKFADPIFTQIYTKNKQIIELQKARDRLLPKLMSGEMEINNG